jgi:hypothetical protein
LAIAIIICGGLWKISEGTWRWSNQKDKIDHSIIGQRTYVPNHDKFSIRHLWKLLFIYLFTAGHHENLKLDFEKTEEIGQLASAFYSGLWAYDGWYARASIYMLKICYNVVRT